MPYTIIIDDDTRSAFPRTPWFAYLKPEAPGIIISEGGATKVEALRALADALEARGFSSPEAEAADDRAFKARHP